VSEHINDFAPKRREADHPFLLEDKYKNLVICGTYAY